jgi:hypothetical protein
MVKYSDDPRDLSACKKYEEYLAKMVKVFEQSISNVRDGGFIVLLIGDLRRKGKYYPMAFDIYNWVMDTILFDDYPISNRTKFGHRYLRLHSVLIKEQHNVTSSGWVYGNKFIPIMHEYCLIYQKVGK